MVERIDAYSHVLTQELLEDLSALDPGHDKHPPDLLFLENIDERVGHLDRLGVDKQVISQAEPRVWPAVDPDDPAGLEVTRFGNDEIRRYADTYPDRFVPIGTVPFLTDDYLDEARRCIEELDMAGIQIWSNIGGRSLDEDAFDAFWGTVDDLGVPVWIHPQIHHWHDFDPEDHWLYSMFGWPFDTTIAIARLVFNGVLDRHPNVRVVSHHLGGYIPYVEERMYSWVQTRREYAETEHADAYTGTEAIASLSEPIESYFDRVYADTAVSSRERTHALESGLAFFGEDNVLFGADLPFGEKGGVGWMEKTIPTIENMDISETAKRKIFAENVERLID